MKKFIKNTILAAILGISIQIQAQENQAYQRPPKEIADLIEAPGTPGVRFSTNGEWILLTESPGYPTIEEVAQPEARLAGLRIDPARNSASRANYFISVKLKSVKTGKEYTFSGLPKNLRIGDVAWSTDEKYIALTNATDMGMELWVADLTTYRARKLSNEYLNDAYGTTMAWTKDGKSILAKFIPANRGLMPPKPAAPVGPAIQQSLGRIAPTRTYQDLLQNQYDEQLFDYFLTGQLKLVGLDGKTTNIGQQGLIRNFEYSPDGEYLLFTTIKRPYSYLVPVNAFPYRVELLDKAGIAVKILHDAGLADNLPTGFDAVVMGPRSFSWRPDKPATLYWAEAQDAGNPNKEVAIRDVVFTQAAPFTAEPKRLAEAKFRYSGIDWLNDGFAILNERWWKSRTERKTIFSPAAPTSKRVLSERSYENTYTDPGNFLTVRNDANRDILLTEKNDKSTEPDNISLFTIGQGTSPEGDRPFLLKWNLKTNEVDTLFRSKAPYFERPVFFNNQKYIIISRESAAKTPNYFWISTAKKNSAKAITNFVDPFPALRTIQKQQLSYKRNDGLTMTGTLYTPADYKKENGPLPLLIWAYPREFKTAAAASQVKGSPYQFTRINWGSPVYWVLRGYAVLDNADMPIVGEGKNEPNDTFVAQVKANAQAAIDYVVGLGVADRKRIAVGGHSYGAFMTANLLAHTNLFAAGIARSGAYNRTLTPFGFQQEERTYWQSPEIYNQMSPFSYANKVKTPLLLIHGEADDNSGTFPIQSERFYSALKGHGAITRLVFLPNEAHGYRAKESIMHMLWEMDTWLEKYVKNKE